MDWHKYLVALIKQRGMTQADVTRAMKAGSGAIQKFKDPDYSPTFDTLRRLAKALGVTVAEVLLPKDRKGMELPDPPTAREVEALGLARAAADWEWHSILGHVAGLERLRVEMEEAQKTGRKKKKKGARSGSART